MAVNKVVKSDGTTLIDLTGDTVTSSGHIMAGYVGHLADGSQVTGTGQGGSSVTEHTIYFEFSDSTNTSITVCYDDSLIGSMITAYTPSTYNNKTVTLAELDGVAWYEPADIPLNTQLIDFNSVTNDIYIDSDGTIMEQEWYGVSDYTVIDPSMTFTYKGMYWGYVIFYDSSRNYISSLSIYSDATQDTGNANVGNGTLTPAKIPSNAMYVRIDTVAYASSSELSLIRTA